MPSSIIRPLPEIIIGGIIGLNLLIFIIILLCYVAKGGIVSAILFARIAFQSIFLAILVPARFLYHTALSPNYHGRRLQKKGIVASRDAIQMDDVSTRGHLFRLLNSSRQQGSDRLHFAELLKLDSSLHLSFLNSIPRLSSSTDPLLQSTRQSTCNPGEKTQCWSCSNQICSVSPATHEIAS